MRKNNYANAECLAPDVKRNRFVCGPHFPFGFAPHPILLVGPFLFHTFLVQDCRWNPCGFQIHCVIRRRLGPESVSIQDISTTGSIRYQRSEETRDKTSIKALAFHLVCAHTLMTLRSHQQQKVQLQIFLFVLQCRPACIPQLANGK